MVDGVKVEDNTYQWSVQDSQEDEQVSIWAVRRKLLEAYFVLFSLLFTALTGVALWLESTPVSNSRQLTEVLTAAMGFASARVLWLASFSIISVEVGNVIVEYLIVDRYKRGKKVGIEEGKKAGIKEGKAGERSRWQTWYERMQAAQREGRAFDEPPPGDGEQENGLPD